MPGGFGSSHTSNANVNAALPPGHQAANSSTAANNSALGGGDGSGMAHLPGHYLPFEEITLPPHLMPLNPEDEDDVVPDMHAAFGINRALGQHQFAAGAGASAAASVSAAIAGGGGGSGVVVVAGGVGGSGGATGAGEPGGEASNAGVQREPLWRDLGLEALIADVRINGRGPPVGARREGRRTGLLALR